MVRSRDSFWVYLRLALRSIILSLVSDDDDDGDSFFWLAVVAVVATLLFTLLHDPIREGRGGGRSVVVEDLLLCRSSSMSPAC